MNNLEKYIISRWIYSIGEEYITNEEYTILEQVVKKEYPDSVYLQRSWSSDPCPVKLLQKYGLDDKILKVVLSDKTESIPSLNSLTKIREAYWDIHYGTLSFKHDGWNLQASYVEGILVKFNTRGRDSDSVNVSHMRYRIPDTIPVKGSVTIVMECTISDVDYEFCKKRFGSKSQRGAVSTLLANPEYSDRLSLHAFDILCATASYDIFPTLISWGFKVPTWCTIDSYDQLIEKIEEFSSMEESYPYPTDGLVVKSEKTRAIRILAWEEPIYKSYVLTEEEAQEMYNRTPYLENYGCHRISVGTYIYPISLKNSTQKQIPLTNIQRILDLDLSPGSPIAFRIASSSIADLEETVTNQLHSIWENNYEQYRKEIRDNEKLKHQYYGGVYVYDQSNS